MADSLFPCVGFAATLPSSSLTTSTSAISRAKRLFSVKFHIVIVVILCLAAEKMPEKSWVEVLCLEICTYIDEEHLVDTRL